VLADFGMARSHTQSMSIRKTASGACGTLNWMAPEMISDGQVSQAIDVYAFGIIVWEMCSGMIPWAGLAEQTIMFKVAMKGERPTMERERWPAWACDLMGACWHQDPKQRPTMADVLARLRAVAALITKPAVTAPALVVDVKTPTPSVPVAASGADQSGPPSAVAIASPTPVSGQAEEWFRKGHCFVTGTGGVAKDEREAVKWYLLSADQGYAIAQFNLGVCYRYGHGVATDRREAVKWYRLAADQGHADAQFNLGLCYYNGTGVTTDMCEAVKWYRLAADQGVAGAVSGLYHAALQGHAVAQFVLGVCLANGTGGRTKDEREAVKWYRQAADQGCADAQFNLGDCYYHGTGATKDERKAAKWYRLAADQGHADAAEYVKKLEKRCELQ
jgi:hypothetical protein